MSKQPDRVSMRTVRSTRGTSSLKHQSVATEPWSFDAEVVACYDDMIVRSIPNYSAMREVVTALATCYAPHDATIIDLGCSQGGALATIIAQRGATHHYIGVDNSAPMLESARERFAAAITDGWLEIRETDLRHNYPAEHAAVTLAVLTLQFVPIEYRQRLVQRMYEHTQPGGACIIIEKVLGATAALDDAMIAAYYALKAANGYSAEQIAAKRRSLEGVLVPLTADWNEDMLHRAGFTQIDCCWRWMNFAGWVALRDA